MLPGRVYVARGYLPEGEHKVVINGRDFNVNVTVGGQYALVPLRLYNQNVVVGDVGNFGQLATQPVVAAADAKPAPAAAVEQDKKTKSVPRKPVKNPVAAATVKPTL